MLSAETVNSVPDMLSAAEAALEEGRELPEVARLLFSLISAPQTRGSALDRGGVGTRMLAALCKLAALTVATQARAQAVALSALDLVLRPDDEGGSLSYVTDDPVATHTTAVVRALGKACAPPSPPAASELAVSLLRRLAGAQPEVLRASADAWLPQAVELALATGHMADALGPDPTPPADGGGGGSGGNGKDAGGSGGSGNDVAVSDADGDGADGSSSRAGGEARQRCESAVELLGSVLPWPEHAHAMPLSLCWAVWAVVEKPPAAGLPPALLHKSKDGRIWLIKLWGRGTPPHRAPTRLRPLALARPTASPSAFSHRVVEPTAAPHRHVISLLGGWLAHPPQREKLNQLLQLPTGAFVAKEGELPAYEARALMFVMWRRLVAAWVPPADGPLVGAPPPCPSPAGAHRSR